MGVFSGQAATLDEQLREDGPWHAARTPAIIGFWLALLIPLSIIWCGILPVIGLLWFIGYLP